MILLLLNAGTNVNTKNNDGETAQQGRLSTIAELVYVGAKINVESYHGAAPHSYASRYWIGCAGTVSRLTDESCRAPMDWLQSQGAR